MAAKQTQTQAAGEQDKLYPVEELQKRTKTREALHRGVCAAGGWTAGKLLTEAAYRQAVTDFQIRPMGRA